RRRPEPLGAVPLVGQAAFAEVTQRVRDLALGVEPGLVEPVVEVDAELAEVPVLLGLEARDGPVPEPSAALGGLHGPEPLAGFRLGLAGEVADVVAVVAVFGERHVVALELEPADLEGLTQPLHLGARVVDVELAGGVVSGPLPEPGDSRPEWRR